MKYLVLEIQKFDDGTIAVPPIATFDTIEEAKARYYSILSVAAVSTLPMHSALILTEDGKSRYRETCLHAISTEEPQENEYEPAGE